MKVQKFTLTSDKFKGEVLFEFSDLILTKYDISGSELSEEQMVYIAKNIPKELAEVYNLIFRLYIIYILLAMPVSQV